MSNLSFTSRGMLTLTIFFYVSSISDPVQWRWTVVMDFGLLLLPAGLTETHCFPYSTTLVFQDWLLFSSKCQRPNFWSSGKGSSDIYPGQLRLGLDGNLRDTNMGTCLSVSLLLSVSHVTINLKKLYNKL